MWPRGSIRSRAGPIWKWRRALLCVCSVECRCAAGVRACAGRWPRRSSSARSRSRARRSRPVRRPALAIDRAVPRRARQRRQRRAGAAERLLHGIGRRRRVEDRPTPAAPGSRSSTRSRSPRSARSPSRRRTRHRLRRHRRSRHAVADLVRQRHVQVDRRRQDVDAHRPRSTRGRSAKVIVDPRDPNVVLRRGARPRLRRATRIAASTARATAARHGRRCSSRATTSARSISRSIRQPADALRLAVEHAASAVEHLSAVVRSGQRALQVDRRRHDLAAADAAVCRPKASAASASPSRRPIRTRVYAIVDAKEGGLFRSDDAGATFDQGVGRQRASGAAAGTSARSPSIRRTPTSSTCPTPASTGRATAARRSARRSRGRPAATTITSSGSRPDDRQPHDPRRRPGRGDQRRRLDEHPTWSSWLNQPTAQLYHVAADYRFPYWVTGAQQDSGAVRVRSRGRFAEHHDARLGAALRRRRERLHRARSAASRDPVRRHRRHAATSRPARRRTSRRKSICRRRRATPGPMPLVFSLADPHALYFGNQFVFKTTDGGESWTRISEDLTRENPGVPPNLDAADRRRRAARGQAPRRRLHDRAVAAARAAASGSAPTTA